MFSGNQPSGRPAGQADGDSGHSGRCFMKKHVNYYFLTVVIILMVAGALFLATLSAPASLQTFGNTNYYLFHQLFAILIGFILATVAFKIPLHVLKKIAPIILAVNLLLLVVVFLPVVGTKFWGAKRWISIGQNTIQPSEFLKITSIIYLASWLSAKLSESSKKGWIFTVKKGYHNFVRMFLPFLFLLGMITIILFFQKDVSTLGIIGITLLVVYFASGLPFWHTLLLMISGILGSALLIKIEPYRAQRFLTFLHPESDPLGRGFQLKQSLMAMGSGGIFGKGLGMSTQKFGFLPQAMSDSIFAILGEETGIVGTSILIIIFLLFLWQGFKIARSATDTFSKLTSVGITFWILFQAFVNISSAIGIFPLSGIPLPFLSYGGSHIVAEMIGVGIMLNISKNG